MRLPQILPVAAFSGILLLLASCTPKNNETQTAAQAPSEQSQRPLSTRLPDEKIPSPEGATSMSVSSCTLKWTGSMFIGDAHTGTLPLKKGNLLVKDGFVLGGQMVFDMKGLKNIDIESSEDRERLEKHLHSADFFDTQKFPTATFVIRETLPSVLEEGINRTILGDLTIKGITRPISFPVSLSVTDNEVQATSPRFGVNRTHFGIMFKSNAIGTAKNAMIADDIQIELDLIAGK